MSFVFMLGMAGSGKTTLTASFGDWLAERGESVARVNLDPGVIRLPYKPDWDVREIVYLPRIMKEEGLGPNGGLLRANEIMLERISEIAMSIKKLALTHSYIIVDTPGQMELFAFHELGSRLLKALGLPSSVAIFLIDASKIEGPADAIMSVLLSLAVMFHLEIDTVMILNKVDISGGRGVEFVRMLFSDPEELAERLREFGGGLLGEMASRLLADIAEFLPPSRVVAISAATKEGFEDLYSIIHDVFCGCGDLM